MSPVAASAATQQRDVVVIGGGQAGLAIGYFLAEQGRRFTIEAAGEPAAAWRARVGQASAEQQQAAEGD